MTANYTPKVGDKVELVRRVGGVVTSIEMDRGPGGIVWVDNRPLGYYLSEFAPELVEAASVPFEVGKPLTEAMGEPPVGSVVQDGVGRVHQRSTGGWFAADSRSFRYDWSSFSAERETLTLIYLPVSK